MLVGHAGMSAAGRADEECPRNVRIVVVGVIEGAISLALSSVLWQQRVGAEKASPMKNHAYRVQRPSPKTDICRLVATKKLQIPERRYPLNSEKFEAA
jgi:hypothetical protein